MTNATKLHYTATMIKVNPLEQLKNQGFRLTKVRLTIIKILTDLNRPQTSRQILEALRRQKLNVNKTTVYRELDFLLKQNLVEELNFQTQAKLYEISGPHHHHLICLNCDRIEEVVLKNDLAKEEKRLAKNNNFKILKHSLEFFGSCKNCCAKNNS